MAVLLWEYYHGGVKSHHLLNRKDLPALSNWWNLVWLPALTWLLLYRIDKRKLKPAAIQSKRRFRIDLFISGIILGIILSLSFSYDIQFILDSILYLFLFLALFIPLFYSEFILGFVLSMTVTFGAILPTIFAVIVSVAGYLIFQFVRPLLIRAVLIFRKN